MCKTLCTRNRCVGRPLLPKECTLAGKGERCRLSRELSEELEQRSQWRLLA